MERNVGYSEKEKSVTIRFAREGEAVKIISFWEDQKLRVSIQDDEKKIENMIANESANAGLIIAECGEEIVGTLLATNDGLRGYLHRVAVSPEFRREGIASRLVDQGENWFSTQNVDRVSILVEENNETGNEFWKSKGFKVDPNIVRWTKDVRPDSPETFVLRNDELCLDEEVSYENEYWDSII